VFLSRKSSQEEIVKVSRWLFAATGSRRAARAALLSFSAVFFLVAASVLANAQSGAMSPYQGEADGVSAGGNWLKFASTDKMTGAHKVRF
jgi:hypothetical protein